MEASPGVSSLDWFNPGRTMVNDSLTWIPPMDVYEIDNNYILNAEVPGVERCDIEVAFSGLEFTVRGERKFDPTCARENYQRIEGHRGRFQRTFSLPEPVDSKRMQLELRKGVLRIVLPKAGGAKNRSRGGR
jgi:HSP20 family protein